MRDFSNRRKGAVSTAALTDALGRLSTHRAHVLDLVSPTPGRVLQGRAVTIRFVPFREDVFDAQVNNFARLFYQAVPAHPEETVLVLDSGGHPDISVGGGTKFSRLQNRKLAGLLTDGRLRDFGELERYEPVFYCSGETVKAGTADLMPIAANVPVVIGGVTVLPGDFVYVDAAAAVIIPSTLVDETFQLAARIELEDAAFVTSIRGEDPREIRISGAQES
ncbi:dimethylmenaquinone methyltransferase [Arthrobacter sp. Soil736]|uniref:RraA family protein n=1 Tax=Arthrobacter sp. Soil736 TaxID=1736395 RepID=UPI0006FA377E|nr:dimethylmenaquinone methyltransferase [Arthrobacter sp. Soil736]KRE67692.1 dimethylmenaquinone methyltransferase [Arthrobacter sp. Soil736]